MSSRLPSEISQKGRNNDTRNDYPAGTGFDEIATRFPYGFSGSQCRTLFHHAKRREIRLNIVIQSVLALVRLRLVLPTDSLVRSAEHNFIAQKGGKSG